MYTTIRRIFRNFKITTGASVGYCPEALSAVCERAWFSYLICNEVNKDKIEAAIASKPANFCDIDTFFYQDLDDLSFWLKYTNLKFDLVTLCEGDFYTKRYLLEHFIEQKTPIILFNDYDPSSHLVRSDYFFVETSENDRRLGIFYRDIIREAI